MSIIFLVLFKVKCYNNNDINNLTLIKLYKRRIENVREQAINKKGIS